MLPLLAPILAQLAGAGLQKVAGQSNQEIATNAPLILLGGGLKFKGEIPPTGKISKISQQQMTCK